MATCRFCGKSAGMLRSVHPECQQRYDYGLGEIYGLAKGFMESGIDNGLFGEISNVCRAYRLDPSEAYLRASTAWLEAFERFISDGVLTPAEDERLAHGGRLLCITEETLRQHRVPQRIAMAHALQDLLQGRLPSNVPRTAALPFNFQKSESLVWCFPHVQYAEERTRRQYVGGYQGMSFRVAKGVYYRVGGFRGQPVETQQMERLDTGSLAFTTRHLYFAGDVKSFRIPYGKIVSHRSFSYGIGIVRDAASARPQIFITNDGWFAYNLLVNLAERA